MIMIETRDLRVPITAILHFMRHGIASFCIKGAKDNHTREHDAHFTTHTTGDGIDDPALAWNLWWVKVRLEDGSTAWALAKGFGNMDACG